MVTDSTSTAPAATLPLSERIQTLINNHNRQNAEYLVRIRPEYLGEPIARALEITDVIKAVSASNLSFSFGRLDPFVIVAIIDEIMKEIAVGEYDPWPDLTKKELRFLIGDRRQSSRCPFALDIAAWCKQEPDLSFSERVLADRHRKWLTYGSTAKRKRLAKEHTVTAKPTAEAA